MYDKLFHSPVALTVGLGFKRMCRFGQECAPLGRTGGGPGRKGARGGLNCGNGVRCGCRRRLCRNTGIERVLALEGRAAIGLPRLSVDQHGNRIHGVSPTVS